MENRKAGVFKHRLHLLYGSYVIKKDGLFTDFCFCRKSLALEELFVGGKPVCRYFYFQLLVVVSAGFGESTFSYGTGGKLLGLNGDRSKGLAVVESFFTNGRNFGANLYSP